MSPLSVRADSDTVADGGLAAAVASLPLSLRNAEPGQPADLVAVDGGRGWPERMVEALRSSPLGLMIVRPTPVRFEPPPAAPPVVVDYRFAGNPATTPAAAAFARWPADALIEVTAVVPAASQLPATLLDQLATLRRLSHPVVGLTRLTWDVHGYHLQGATVEGALLMLTAHVTTAAPGSLRVRGLAAHVVVELALPDPSTARPAVLTSTTYAGATTAPALWETSHRTAWRRLHTAVMDARPTNDLIDLRADLAVATPVAPSVLTPT